MPLPALALPLIAGGLDMLGGLFGANAQNKGAKQSYAIDKRRLQLDENNQNFMQQLMAAQEGRTGESDAWRKMLAAGYAQNRGQQPQLSPYSVAPRSLQGAQGGADALLAEVMARLQGGNPIQPTPMNVFEKPAPGTITGGFRFGAGR
jgi:hypothetical protein